MFDPDPLTLLLMGRLKTAIHHLVHARLPVYQAMASKPSTDQSLWDVTDRCFSKCHPGYSCYHCGHPSPQCLIANRNSWGTFPKLRWMSRDAGGTDKRKNLWLAWELVDCSDGNPRWWPWTLCTTPHSSYLSKTCSCIWQVFFLWVYLLKYWWHVVNVF